MASARKISAISYVNQEKSATARQSAALTPQRLNSSGKVVFAGP